MKIIGLNQLPNLTKSSFAIKDDLKRVAKPRIVEDAVIESAAVLIEDTLVKNVRQTIGKDDEVITSTVSNLKDSGYIRLNGEYTQNYVDFRTTDISNIKVVDGTTFRFLLSIKETIDDANPTLYTSKKFYDDLVGSYSQNNPYNVAAATKQEAIVVITLDTLKQKVESLHDLELNQTADYGVLVLKNLFATANFNINVDVSVKDYKKAVSNPTYNIEDVVRYIDWVVSKPNANYEDRLISGKQLGRWKYNNGNQQVFDSIVPKEDEVPNNLNNPTTFPPFGRPGDFQNEIDTDDNDNDWQWNINTQRWDQLTTEQIPPQPTSPPIVTPPIIAASTISPPILSSGGGSPYGGGGGPSRYYR